MQTEPISKTTIHGLRTELADLCSIFTKALAAAETPTSTPLPLFPQMRTSLFKRLDEARRGPFFIGQALSYQKPLSVSSKFRHCVYDTIFDSSDKADSGKISPATSLLPDARGAATSLNAR